MSIAVPIGDGTGPVLGMGWQSTAAVMLGDMFGLGQLTLPQTYARVGWLPATLLIAGFCVLTLYSARLYTRLALACPDATMFDQVASRAMGRVGSALVWVSCYVSILLCPLIFQITCAEALKQVLYLWPVSSLTANLVVAGMIVPLAQFQELEGIALVSLLGTLGQIVAIVVVIGKLATTLWEQKRDGLPPPRTHMSGADSFPAALVGVMDTLFCYGGQPNWWRYMGAMSNKSHFVRSSCVAVTFMTCFYVTVAVVGYLALGDDVDVSQALTSLLEADMWTAVMNAGLFLHCLFAYQININVWASTIMELSSTWKHGATTTTTTAADDDSTPTCNGNGTHTHPPHTPMRLADSAASLPDSSLKAPLLSQQGQHQHHQHQHQGSCTEPEEPCKNLGQCTAADSACTAHVGLRCQVTWAVLTCVCIVACVVASLTLPFFSIIMAVISASGDAMALVGLPCLISLYLIRDLPMWERPVCCLAVVGAVVLSGLGMFSSLQQLIAAYSQGA